MAYVGMTRGRDENHLAIYPAVTNEADQHHHGADTGIHQMCRGTKHSAAHYFRMILANDDRARTMHAVAAHTNRDLLPPMSRPRWTATTNVAPPAPRPGGSTPPKPAHAKPHTNASPPPGSRGPSGNAAAV